MSLRGPLPRYVTTEYLEHLHLRSGVGSGKAGDCCIIQERRRWDGLDPRSDDIPDDDSIVVGKLLIQLNDASAVWRAKLGPYAVRLRGSGRAGDERRAIRLVDWTLREILPDAIDSTVALSGDSEPIRELARMAGELRAAKPVAAIATLADLDALAARAALATRAAIAARAAIADLAVLAALADHGALDDLAKSEATIWPRIAALLDELLGMSDEAAGGAS